MSCTLAIDRPSEEARLAAKRRSFKAVYQSDCCTAAARKNRPAEGGQSLDDLQPLWRPPMNFA